MSLKFIYVCLCERWKGTSLISTHNYNTWHNREPNFLGYIHFLYENRALFCVRNVQPEVKGSETDVSLQFDLECWRIEILLCGTRRRNTIMTQCFYLTRNFWKRLNIQFVYETRTTLTYFICIIDKDFEMDSDLMSESFGFCDDRCIQIALRNANTHYERVIYFFRNYLVAVLL